MNQILLTNRLSLSPVSTTDLKKIHELHLLPETDRFNTLGIPKNITETEKILKEWILKSSPEKNTSPLKLN